VHQKRVRATEVTEFTGVRSLLVSVEDTPALKTEDAKNNESEREQWVHQIKFSDLYLSFPPKLIPLFEPWRR
jgi:hypothetical protein